MENTNTENFNINPNTGQNINPQINQSPNSEKVSILDQIENFLDQIFGKKAPVMPVKYKEVFVKFAPWGQILLILVLVPTLLAAIGLGSLFYTIAIPFFPARAHFYGFQGIISLVFSLGFLIMRGISIPGLFAESKTGWKWCFYATLAGLVDSVFFGLSVSALVSSAITFYVLFQIKEYYK